MRGDTARTQRRKEYGIDGQVLEEEEVESHEGVRRSVEKLRYFDPSHMASSRSRKQVLAEYLLTERKGQKQESASERVTLKVHGLRRSQAEVKLRRRGDKLEEASWRAGTTKRIDDDYPVTGSGICTLSDWSHALLYCCCWGESSSQK